MCRTVALYTSFTRPLRMIRKSWSLSSFTRQCKGVLKLSNKQELPLRK